MKVQDIMSKKPSYLSPKATLHDVAQIMRDHHCGIVPIAENDRLVGVVTDRDMVLRGIANGLGANASAYEAMSQGVLYCYAEDDVHDALRNMKEQEIQRLIVLDNRKNKHLVGMLAMSDIAASTARAPELAKLLADCSRVYTSSHFH